MIDDLLKNKKHGNRCLPQGLIIAPTRELANQIYDECRKFSNGTSLKTVVAFGGTSISSQMDKISNGCDILIGTPGRIQDLLTRGVTSLSLVKYVVLDEADRMLDMGFEASIREIMNEFELPSNQDRTTMMFSATFPPAIRHLASDFLKENYFFISVGRVGGTTDLIDQQFIFTKPYERLQHLEGTLKKGQKTLIFVNSKSTASQIEYALSAKFRVTSIHGDKTQRQRDAALQQFKNDNIDILIGTDVASRGLDINDISLVINYEFPKEIDSYVHRIGRTGRKGKKGKSLSFISPFEPNYLIKELVTLLGQNKKQEIPEWLVLLSTGKNRNGSPKSPQNRLEPRKSYPPRNYENSERGYGNSERSYGNSERRFENSERKFENYSPKKYKY
jgi:ATP-dependent RNA helicase DDX3X